MNLLFVCTGNIHRSPLAEAMLRDAAQRQGRSDVEVMSAGTATLDGLAAASEAAALAASDGLDLSRHRSRRLTGEELARADLILMMESYHYDWIAGRHPAALPRCRLLSDYAGPETGLQPGEDVPDAIGEDIESFRVTYGILRSCVDRLARELLACPQAEYSRAIEERYRQRRGSPLAISPADYDAIERWWSQGIPLWIVLESIDRAFRPRGPSRETPRVRRLAYIEPDIEERYEAYVGSRVDGPPPATGVVETTRSESAVRKAIATALERLTEGGALGSDRVASAFEVAATRVRSMTAASEPSTLILGLQQIEDDLIDALKKVTDPAEMHSLRQAAASEVAPHAARMTPEAVEATIARVVDYRIRERYAVPKLT